MRSRMTILSVKTPSGRASSGMGSRKPVDASSMRKGSTANVKPSVANMLDMMAYEADKKERRARRGRSRAGSMQSADMQLADETESNLSKASSKRSSRGGDDEDGDGSDSSLSDSLQSMSDSSFYEEDDDDVDHLEENSLHRPGSSILITAKMVEEGVRRASVASLGADGIEALALFEEAGGGSMEEGGDEGDEEDAAAPDIIGIRGDDRRPSGKRSSFRKNSAGPAMTSEGAVSIIKPRGEGTPASPMMRKKRDSMRKNKDPMASIRDAAPTSTATSIDDPWGDKKQQVSLPGAAQAVPSTSPNKGLSASPAGSPMGGAKLPPHLRKGGLGEGPNAGRRSTAIKFARANQLDAQDEGGAVSERAGPLLNNPNQPKRVEKFESAADRAFRGAREKAAKKRETLLETDVKPVKTGWARIWQRFLEFTVSHTTVRYRFWEFFIILLVLYNAVYTPMAIAFIPVDPPFIEGLSVFVDWMFVVDLFLSFFVTYYDSFGNLITDKKEIAKSYLSKWFWVDLPAIIPWEMFFSSASSDANTQKYIKLLKCIRLLRIFHIIKFMEKFRFATVMKIGRLFVWLMLVCHWIGSFWFFIGEEAPSECSTWPTFSGFNDSVPDMAWHRVYPDNPGVGHCSWLTNADLGSCNKEGMKCRPGKSIHWGDQYVISVYWALTTLTSVGYGDISPITDVETIYGIFVMLIGSAVHASLFSSFVSFITLANRHETSFTNKMDGIRSQMRYMRLPDQHTNKVELYYEYIHLCHKGLLNSGQYFFKDLPLPLQLEVCSYLHGETVESVAIFGGVSESFVRAVVVRLLPLICIPNEFIVYKGDIAHAMYFITRGRCQVRVSGNGKVVAYLDEGDYFGDTAILQKRLRTASIETVTYTDLHVLNASDLEALMETFSDDANVILDNTAKLTNVSRTTFAQHTAKYNEGGISPDRGPRRRTAGAGGQASVLGTGGGLDAATLARLEGIHKESQLDDPMKADGSQFDEEDDDIDEEKA